MVITLSQAQDDYIVARANKRGAANKVPSHYLSHFSFGSGGNQLWLNIVMGSDANADEAHGGTNRDTRGAIEQPDVTDEFKDLVDGCLTTALRHMR